VRLRVVVKDDFGDYERAKDSPEKMGWVIERASGNEEIEEDMERDFFYR
jgi:hypothetical protein